MKILEVRDGFIQFEAEEMVNVSSFILIEDIDNSYIAQISQIRSVGKVIIGMAKILFKYNQGELANYEGELPSKGSALKVFPTDIINSYINVNEPIITGKILGKDNYIKTDSSSFNSMLISADDKNLHNILIRNLSKQFNNIQKKVLIIDTFGILNAKKYIAGVDFKLPLNPVNLNFMYESCLNDATEESKSTIIEIFKELSEYSKTVSFVPFGTLKSIVDEMVDKQHVFKLLVLKNKLAKFSKSGYFATSMDEVSNLDKLLSEKCSVIDLSKLDTIFQNRYIEYIYEKISDREDFQVFLEVSNTVSKKNIKNILSNYLVATTFITHSRFQYLKDIQNNFKNFIIEPSINNNESFKVYKSFLSSMPKNTYLITGEAVNFIPFVSSEEIIDEVIPYKKPETNFDKQESGLNTENLESNLDSELKIENDSEEELTEVIENKENQENHLTQEDVLAIIDTKSENAISDIAKNLDSSKNFELFIESNIDEEEQQEQIEDEKHLTSFIEDQEESIEVEEPENKDFIDEYIEPETTEEETTETEEFLENEENGEVLLSEEQKFYNEDSKKEDNSVIESNEEDDLLKNLEETNENLNEEKIKEDSFEQEEPEQIEEDSAIELNNDESIFLEEMEEQELDDSEELLNTNLDVDLSEPKVMPIAGDSLNHDFDEIVELDPSSDIEEGDILVDMSDEEDAEKIDEDIEQQIIEDVDKVYTTVKTEEGSEEISDIDLDLIDELNNANDELEEYHGEELEEVSDSNFGILDNVKPEDTNLTYDEHSEILEKRDSTTPIVPVYDAEIPQEDMVVSDPIQQGDAVIHAKYGNGVVEKMIKYGNKTLFAINFDNVGRRLLDPTLTEIKKV